MRAASGAADACDEAAALDAAAGTPTNELPADCDVSCNLATITRLGSGISNMVDRKVCKETECTLAVSYPVSSEDVKA